MEGTSVTWIKAEPNSCEDFSSDETFKKYDIENETLKLEQTDIKHEIIPDFSNQPYQINTYYDAPNSENVKLEPTAMICDDINMVSEDDNINDSVTICNKSLGSNVIKKVTNSSHLSDLPYVESPYGIEIDIDNTGIYIPLGWKRRVFMRSKLPKAGLVKFDCYYFTELGKRIRSKKEAHTYLNSNPSAHFEFTSLDYCTRKAREALQYLDPSLLEFEVDNTGIYIPVGWRRKVKVSTSPDFKLHYNIIYICQEEKRFGHKSEVDSYLSDFNNTVYIDTGKLNFCYRNKHNAKNSSGVSEFESDVENKRIKIEPIDIKNEIKSDISTHPHQIKAYYDATQDQSHNSETIKLEKTSVFCDDINIISEDENTNDCITISYKSLGTNVILEVPNSSHLSDLSHIESPYGIDIDINNTGIYIPSGWKRRVFMGSRLHLQKGLIRFDCYYFTELGKIIRDKEEAQAYLNSNPSANFEITSLDFSTRRAREALRYLDPSLLEFEVDNTGIYIPVGWRRKVKVSSDSNKKWNYNIIYICPEGIRFRDKSEVDSYLSEYNNKVCIDTMKLNFSKGRYAIRMKLSHI